LISLQGIGQKRAGDIIAYREKHPFTSVNQIMNVSGIGVKTYLKMYSNLVVFGDSTAVEREEAGKNSKTSKSKSTKVKPKNELKTLVNLNTATIKDLCTLEGIGEVKAKAIIDYRNENGAFASVEDITKVKGIGEKTLQKNIHRLTIGR
jgi:competence protein ComEA